MRPGPIKDIDLGSYKTVSKKELFAQSNAPSKTYTLFQLVYTAYNS
jgi:hypothetical protein